MFPLTPFPFSGRENTMIIRCRPAPVILNLVGPVSVHHSMGWVVVSAPVGREERTTDMRSRHTDGSGLMLCSELEESCAVPPCQALRDA